jgi:Sec-independent protein translocase protein TatA
MVILFNFFTLGIAEIAVIVIAVIILIDPKNARMIKPWVKKAYRTWLSYQDEVAEAEKEVEEIKRTVLKPITDAEKEVEAELQEQVRIVKSPLKKAQKMTSKITSNNKNAIINPINEIREELEKERKPVKKSSAVNPIQEIQKDLQKEKKTVKKRKPRKGRK